MATNKWKKRCIYDVILCTNNSEKKVRSDGSPTFVGFIG